MPNPNPTHNNPSQPVITRFAPSPTGYLHIGGARTALFNWAFARRHSGTFILRIEDTDQARSSKECTRLILEELKWLGLDWDQGPASDAPDPYQPESQIGPHGPYFQSQRLDLYRQHIDQLLDSRRAYKCFKTPQQLAADRDKAKQEKRPYKYDPTESLNLTDQQVKAYLSQGRPHVVRFRMPDTDITVDDLVLGPVTIKAPELEDFVIQKSDGYPTFHLANVVDDALMHVTHVLRGQEHLMNTPKHVALQQALGFAPPKYAHMPLIFNADGSKMSKRDKAKAVRIAAKERAKSNNQTLDQFAQDLQAEQSDTSPTYLDRIRSFLNNKNDDSDIVSILGRIMCLHLPEIDVHDFRASGYLPHVILNYISLLGWSPGNDIERFDLDFLVDNFDIARIGKSNARFDRDKLLAFNTEAIPKFSNEDFYQRLKAHDHSFNGARFSDRLGEQKFRLIARCYRERSRTLKEPIENGYFFHIPDDRVHYDPKAIKKVLEKSDGQGFTTLRELTPLLQACDDWTVDALESIIKGYAEQHSLNMGKAAQPLRVAVTGSTVSPPIFDTLVILGKQSTLNRIECCLIRYHTYHNYYNNHGS